MLTKNRARSPLLSLKEIHLLQFLKSTGSLSLNKIRKYAIFMTSATSPPLEAGGETTSVLTHLRLRVRIRLLSGNYWTGLNVGHSIPCFFCRLPNPIEAVLYLLYFLLFGYAFYRLIHFKFYSTQKHQEL